MGFRRISVGHWFVLTVIFAAAVLSVTSYRAEAVETGPDWLHGVVTLSSVEDYPYKDGDQYTVTANVLQEYAQGAHNIGSTLFPNVVTETHKVYPSGVGYFDPGYALPIDASRWQLVDIRGRTGASDAMFPNPTSAGILSIVNMYGDYASREVRYVSDWREMFGDVSADRSGTVTRRVPSDFNYTDYPALKTSSGGSVIIQSWAGLSYSKNGRWLYINTTSGQMRVQLPSMNYVTLAPWQQFYNAVATSVSNDGRFVVEAGQDVGFLVYDTLGCTGSPCASRNVLPDIKNMYAQTITNGTTLSTLTVIGTKFVSNSSVEAEAWVTFAGVSGGKYIKFTVGVDPGPQTVRYLALGDSFSSGEGAGNYYDATAFWADDSNHNTCHQSKQSYSELINKYLTPDWYDSVACSGAQMKDVVYEDGLDELKYYRASSQSKDQGIVSDNDDTARLKLKYFSDNLNPGYVPQQSFVSNQHSTVATVTIGGNDIGFGNIVTACVLSTRCYTNRDDRERLADLIATKIPELKNTYTNILKNMSGDVPRLYVVGYPRVFNQDTECNNFMSREERAFANALVDYLNDAVRIAASQAGAQYIDVSDAFMDYATGKDARLCGNAKQAVNGVVVDLAGMSDTQKLNQFIAESYHPNATGHIMLANRILSYTNNLARPMPAPVATTGEPNSTLYTVLVGDSADAVNEYTEVHQDIVRNSVVELQDKVDFLLSLNHLGDVPDNLSSISIEFHSTPTKITSFTVGADGTVAGSFAVPQGTETGIHTLHIVYKDITGQVHDSLQYILVVGSMADLDGNGVPNGQEACVFGKTSGIDWDKDGIDDACDSEITDPPTPTPTQDTTTTGGDTPDTTGTNNDSSTSQTSGSSETPPINNDPEPQAPVDTSIQQTINTTPPTEESATDDSITAEVPSLLATNQSVGSTVNDKRIAYTSPEVTRPMQEVQGVSDTRQQLVVGNSSNVTHDKASAEDQAWTYYLAGGGVLLTATVFFIKRKRF